MARQPIGFTAPSPAACQPAAPEAAPWVSYRGDGHLVTFGASGEGKTTGPIISNALTWPGQLLVIDIKGEVHSATALARRAMGQTVYTLDMRDGMPSDSLNPIDTAQFGGSDLAMTARALAATTVARTGNEREAFWLDWAESLITAGILIALEDNVSEKRTIGAYFDLLTGGDAAYALALMLDEHRIRHHAAKATIKGFLSMPDRETRPSVLASTIAPLRLFDSETVRRLTGSTTCPLAEFIAGAPLTL